VFLSSLTTEQKEAGFCLSHNVVVSDGDLSIGEERMMAEMRLEMNLAPDFEARYLPLDGIDTIFDSTRARTIILIALIRLAYADGAFEIEEQCFIEDLCSVFGFSREHLDRLENWVRRFNSLEVELTDLFG
jgi:tellurite resistance protein